MTAIAIVATSLILAGLVWLGAWILSWIYEPSINPPIVVIKRRFGKIVKVMTGGKWMLIIPYIESFEKVELSQFIVQVKDLAVTTPDNVSSVIKEIAIYVRPIPENSTLVNYLGVKGCKGVEANLTEIAQQETRQWARSENEEPVNWQQLQSSQDKLVARLREKFAEACGAEISGDKNDSIRLEKYGVFLESVTVGEIIVEESIRNEKTKAAQEELQKKAELADIKTKLEIAKVAAQELEIPVEAAYKITQEFEILRAGKNGGIFKVELGHLPELLDFLKSVLAKNGRGK